MYKKGSASVLRFCVSKASSKGLQMIPDVFIAVSNCNTLGIRLFPTVTLNLNCIHNALQLVRRTQGAINKTVSVKFTLKHAVYAFLPSSG